MTEQIHPLGSAAPPPVPAAAPRKAPQRRRWVLLLLLIPFVALLWPPFYAGAEPRIAGVPRFIWYQFLWIVIGVAVTITVYLLDPSRGDEG